MVLLKTLAVSALLTISAALPTYHPFNHTEPKLSSGKHTLEPFTVTQVPKRHTNDSTYFKNGPRSYFKSLKKFGGDEGHIAVVAAAAAAMQASGPVVATPPGGADVEYDCPVTIGSQTFKLDFDTGSSDLWVLGSKISPQPSGHTLYTAKSGTLQNGQSWKITYGDGSSASGTVYSDTVKIGNTAVSNQIVEMANTASAAFTSSSKSCDGLLGLGFDNINTVRPTQAKTFLTNAINQGLPQKLFTASLKKGAPGSYTFGAINTAQYQGSITYINVDSSRGFWGFQPTSYIIGTQSAVTPSNANVLKGIADTGTTLLLMDSSVVTAYWKAVSGSTYNSNYGAYTFPCSTTPPNFTVVINGYKAVVPGSYMNYARISNTMCFGGLQSNSGIGFNIYGDIFLKSQFVVFARSQSTPRLGFAQQK